jgi:hypothetical protein
MKEFKIFPMKRGFLPFTLIILFFSACSPLSHVTVDLTVPSKDELQDKIQSLTLVNRAADKRYTDDPSDSIQLRFFESQFNLDTLILDVSATDTLLQALGKLLFESGRYDIVIPEDRFLLKDTLNLCADSLSRAETVNLVKLYNTDGVLSLEYFITGIKTDIYKETRWESYSNAFLLFYHAEMKIGYTALFRIYYPNDTMKVNNFFISDTLYWEDSDLNIKDLFRRFTFVKEGLSEAGIAAAVRLSQFIAPTWETNDRAFFSKGNKILLSTGELVMENDWESAMDVWTDAYNNKSLSKAMKSKLEFNIALGNEMLGNINEAILWGVKSYEHFYRPVTYNYLNTLKKRKSLLMDAHEKK